MRAKLPDGRVIAADADVFELNGMTYHGGIRRMTEEDLTRLGIEMVPDAPVSSSPFVYVTEDVANAPGVAIETPVNDDQRKQLLVARAKDRRWQKEVGGVDVGGVPVATDDRSKMMIMGARLSAIADSGFTTPWDVGTGSPVTINATQIIAISDAVAAHVAGCFATYNTVFADIEAGTITTYEEIDAAFA